MKDMIGFMNMQTFILKAIYTTWSVTYFRQGLFPSYLFFGRQFHAFVNFRLKSSSDIDSGSLPKLYSELMYAKLRIVLS